jgi:hypothetical protein
MPGIEEGAFSTHAKALVARGLQKGTHPPLRSHRATRLLLGPWKYLLAARLLPPRCVHQYNLSVWGRLPPCPRRTSIGCATCCAIQLSISRKELR